MANKASKVFPAYFKAHEINVIKEVEKLLYEISDRYNAKVRTAITRDIADRCDVILYQIRKNK